MRRRFRRPGLRSRVTLAFGLGAFAVSVVLAVATDAVASRYLSAQRDTTTMRQATFNARVVQAEIVGGSPVRINDLLERLDASSGATSSPLVFYEGRWYDSLYPPGHDEIPAALASSAIGGQAARQRFETEAGTGDPLEEATGPQVAIALPLPEARAVYVEVFSLVELDRTLRTIGGTFVLTGTVATLFGFALGFWASRRALSPLTAVNEAAAAFTSGDLTARLDAGGDPDLRGLAATFNETAAALQARIHRDARFAGNVSHELRTPLTTMLNAVEVMEQRRDRLTDSAREAFDLLAEDVRRFARMVEDLLEISRLDTGDQRLDLEPVQVAELVRLAADRAAGRAVTQVRPGAEDAGASLDKRRVERVIVNLVENARAHAGGVDRVTVEQKDGLVCIGVEDSGPGVPPEQRERIFERFARGAPGIDDTGGVGLGLSLVTEHVKLHRGRVWVEDREGGGARFVVELPAEQA